MKKNLFKIITLIVASVFGINLLAPAAFAANDVKDICDSRDAPQAVRDANGCDGNANSLPIVIQNILNAIIAILGTVAVIFIIIGGVNYMTSNGDAGKVEKGKKTIIYACIGLVISALAFIIVNWTIGTIGTATNSQSEADCINSGKEWKDNQCVSK